MNEGLRYPLKLFVFNVKQGSEWKYDPQEVITIVSAMGLYNLQPYVGQQIRDKYEVRITDADDFCVFHAMGGQIIFPKMPKKQPK